MPQLEYPGWEQNVCISGRRVLSNTPPTKLPQPPTPHASHMPTQIQAMKKFFLQERNMLCDHDDLSSIYYVYLLDVLLSFLRP